MVDRTSSIVHRLKVKSSPERIYSALTETTELLKWGPTQVEIDLKEGGGFRQTYQPYSEILERGQFLRIIPNQLLKFEVESSLFPTLNREASVELKSQGQHTLVIVSEAGWKKSKLWEKMFGSCQESWKQTLQALKTYLETGKDPRSGKKITVPESSQFQAGTLAVKQKYLYRVKPKKVFQALTVADRLTKWFLKEAEVQFKKNGSIKMVWHNGVKHECKILELDLNKKLTLSWPTDGCSGTPHVHTQVNFKFIPTEDDNTILELEHSGLGSGENWVKFYGVIHSGWTYYLLNLKSVLENGIDLRDQRSEFAVREPLEVGEEENTKAIG